MDIRPAVAVRTRYQARPGRRVIVVTDLADLHGPAHGTVTLPLWLYWSGTSPAAWMPALRGGTSPRRAAGSTGCPIHQAFASIGLSKADVSSVRDRFASWPRTAEAAESVFDAGSPAPCSLW